MFRRAVYERFGGWRDSALPAQDYEWYSRLRGRRRTVREFTRAARPIPGTWRVDQELEAARHDPHHHRGQEDVLDGRRHGPRLTRDVAAEQLLLWLPAPLVLKLFMAMRVRWTTMKAVMTGERILPDECRSEAEYILYLRHLFVYRTAASRLRASTPYWISAAVRDTERECSPKRPSVRWASTSSLKLWRRPPPHSVPRRAPFSVTTATGCRSRTARSTPRHRFRPSNTCLTTIGSSPRPRGCSSLADRSS